MAQDETTEETPEEETSFDPLTTDNPAGVDEGTVLTTTLHESEGGKQVEEVIVHDRDEDGNLIGWHKEPGE